MEKWNKIMNFLKLKIILIIAIVILAAIVICSLLYYFLTLKEAIWDEDEKGRPSEYTNNVKISNDIDEGGITIDKDKLINDALKDLGYKEKDIKNFKDKEIIEKLGLEKKLKKDISSLDDVTAAELMWCTNNIYSKYLSKVDELEKLLNAEIITQYPKIKNNKDKNVLDGIIEFERHDSEGGVKKLTYMKKSSFDALIAANDTSVVNYFTLDDEGNAVFGVINTVTEEFSTNDDAVNVSDYSEGLKDGESKKVTHTASTITVDYKSAVSKYTMPFEYLWSLLVVGRDKDFVLELADLVEDSEITISLYDNITTTVNEEVHTYKKETKTVTSTSVQEVNDKGQVTYAYSNGSSESFSTDPKEYKITHTFTYEEDNLMYDLTKANVWIVDYSKEYDFQAKKKGKPDKNTVNIGDSEFVDAGSSSSSSVNEKTKDITTTTYHYYIHKVGEQQVNTITPYNQSYVAKTPNCKYKVEKNDENPNFVNILCKKEHEAAKRLLTDTTKGGTPNWLFEILKSSDKTSNMVDLTKYLFYKVTNISFGVNDDNFDFSMFDVPSFEEAEGNGTSNINGIQGQIADFFLGKGMSLEGVAALLGNIQQESNFNSSVVSKSGNYIGLCQWGRLYKNTPSRGTELEKYATKKGKNWTDADIQIEFIWKELNSNGYSSVKSKLMSATNTSETAEYFARYYEKCVNSDGSLQDIDKRKKYAENWLKELKNRATSGSSSSININGTSDQKLKELFPSGVPNSSSQMAKYLATVKVDITTKSGVKTTKFITVHKSIAKDVQDIFKEAQNGGFKIYDATGYSWREMNNGSSGSRSHHSYGVAIDINVNENYSHRGSKIYAGSFWNPSTSEFSIPRNGVLVKAFKKRGWSWGGNWSGNYQDYMHFSFTGH